MYRARHASNADCCGGNFQESHHEHESHARDFNRRMGEQLRQRVVDDGGMKHDDDITIGEKRNADDDDIGARPDPNTVFKRGEKGNYEPMPETKRDGPGALRILM